MPTSASSSAGIANAGVDGVPLSTLTTKVAEEEEEAAVAAEELEAFRGLIKKS